MTLLHHILQHPAFRQYMQAVCPPLAEVLNAGGTVTSWREPDDSHTVTVRLPIGAQVRLAEFHFDRYDFRPESEKLEVIETALSRKFFAPLPA